MSLIINIDRKLRELGYVRFINGQLLSGNGDVIDQIAGGDGGGSVQVMIPVPAFASDPSGTGFTLTNNDTLQYMAWAVLPLGQDPVVGDFAGKWYLRKGLPGTDGTGTAGANGQVAGFRVDFDTSTVEDKPATGRIRANNVNLALATKLFLNEMTPSTVDLSGIINVLKDGMLFMLRPNANVSAPLFVYELTADPVDNGDWFTLNVSNLTASSTTFLNGDECTFQFYGTGGAASVTEAAILASGDFVRTTSNGAGGLKLIDKTNVDIKVASPVFRMPSMTGITGVADLPAANTFTHGAVIKLHQDNLVGTGAEATGIYLKADAVNNIWRPFGSQTAFSKRYGSLASPTLSLTAAGKFNLGADGDPVIPAALLHAASKIIFRADFVKVGTTTPTVRINMGTDLAARENNSIVYTQQLTSTANMQLPGRSEMSFLSSTTATCMMGSALGGAGAANSWRDAGTLINVASAMKVTFEASTLSGDTVYLLGFQISLEL